MLPTILLEGGGDGGIRGVREMRFAVHDIAVQFRLKGGFHLCGGSAELDPIAAAGRASYGEPLRLEPGINFVEVACGDSEAVGELFRREPFVEVG